MQDVSYPHFVDVRSFACNYFSGQLFVQNQNAVRKCASMPRNLHLSHPLKVHWHTAFNAGTWQSRFSSLVETQSLCQMGN